MSDPEKILIKIFEDSVKIFEGSLRITQGSYKDPVTILKRSLLRSLTMQLRSLKDL